LKRDQRPAEVLPGRCDHGGADVNGCHGQAVRRKLPGELAGSAADLKDRAVRSYPGGIDDELDALRRVLAPEDLVAVCYTIKERPPVTAPGAPLLGLSSHGSSMSAV
jgi:hypothetical protein